MIFLSQCQVTLLISEICCLFIHILNTVDSGVRCKEIMTLDTMQLIEEGEQKLIANDNCIQVYFGKIHPWTQRQGWQLTIYQKFKKNKCRILTLNSKKYMNFKKWFVIWSTWPQHTQDWGSIWNAVYLEYSCTKCHQKYIIYFCRYILEKNKRSL